MFWKDSLNVPVSSQGEWSAKRFYGDPKLAAAYLPVAYALLGAVKNRMAYGDVGFGHQQIELPDGTIIRVLRNGNQNILEISVFGKETFTSAGVLAIYMESGYIEAGVARRILYQSKNQIFEVTTTADESDLIDTIVVNNLPIGIRADNRSHAVPGGVNDKRNLVTFQLMTTGLLRRTVQALIGRADPTYELPPPRAENKGEQSNINKVTQARAIEFLFGFRERVYRPAYLGSTSADLFIDLALVMPTREFTLGLFVDSDYNYFYISIERESVYAYPCLIDQAGIQLREVLRGNVEPDAWKPETQEERDRFESYVLSTLSIDKKKRFLAGKVEDLKGITVSYGWHFNKYGDRADIITLEKLKDRLVYQAHHYRITIILNTQFNPIDAISDDNPPLTASVEEVETSPLSPINGQHNLWIPKHQSFNLHYFYWNEQNFASELHTFDAPVYCFYDAENKLITLRAAYEYLDPEPLPRSWTEDFFKTVWSCDGSFVEDEKFLLRSKYMSGFYVNKENTVLADYRHTTESGQRAYASVSGEPNGGAGQLRLDNMYSHTYTVVNPCRYVKVEDLRAINARGPNTVYFSGVAVNSVVTTAPIYENYAKHAVIIPLLDAEAFFGGRVSTFRDVATQRDFRVTGIGKSETFFDNGAYFEFTYPWPAIPSQRGQIYISGVTKAGEGLAGSYYGKLTQIAKVEVGGQIDLFYKNGVYTTATVNYTADYDDVSERYDSLSGWLSIFYPIVLGPSRYPFVNYPYIVNQGASDNFICYGNPSRLIEKKGHPFIIKDVVATLEDLPLNNPWYGIFSGWA